jgi:plastocyanin
VRRALVLICVAALAGCGSDDDSAPATTAEVPVAAAPKADTDIRLVGTDFKLSPANVGDINEGLVAIEFVNKGDVDHSLAVDGPNGEIFLDGRVPPGKSATLEADLDMPGTYDWYCPLDGHRAKGMSGSITTGGSSPARGATSTRTTTPETTPTQTQTQTTTTTTTQTQTTTTPSGGVPSDEDAGNGTGGASPGGY